MLVNLATNEEKTGGSKRKLKIPWIVRVSNNEFLKKMAAKRTLILRIKKIQLTYFGYIMSGKRWKTTWPIEGSDLVNLVTVGEGLCKGNKIAKSYIR